MRFAFAASLLLLLSLGCQPFPSAPSLGVRFELSDQPPVKVDANKTPFSFGYLTVPENRQQPNSRMIQLPVYIFKSRSKNPAPDPVLYTVGGPGGSSLSAAPYMRAFAYLEDRDLILFEQRGTRYAKPHLACPEWAAVGPKFAGQDLSEAARNLAYVNAAKECRDRLLKEGIDLDGYTTREIAADIEDLRKALKLDQLNLLTISYSTKIAQVMMREYPNSLRSVVMDSPLPLAASYDETSITNLMETYETVFNDCALNPACANQHPQLQARFLSFLDSIQEHPLQLTVDAPKGNKQVTLQLTGKDLVGSLSTTSTGRLPGFLTKVEAVMAGDPEVLASIHSWPRGGSGSGQGMRLSVWCAEEAVFVDTTKVAAERQRFAALSGLGSRVFSFEVCQAWGVRSAPPLENEAISSTVPTLLISGTYDPDTPIKWARQMQQELANSFHLEFPGWGHTPTTYWDNPCAMQAARAFFNQPAEKPAIPCLETLPRFRLE